MHDSVFLDIKTDNLKVLTKRHDCQSKHLNSLVITLGDLSNALGGTRNVTVFMLPKFKKYKVFNKLHVHVLYIMTMFRALPLM